MIEGLIGGRSPEELATLGLGSLKGKRDILADSLDGDLSPRHRLLLASLRDHVRYLEAELAKLDAYLLAAMEPYAWAHRLLQRRSTRKSSEASECDAPREAVGPDVLSESAASSRVETKHKGPDTASSHCGSLGGVRRGETDGVEADAGRRGPPKAKTSPIFCSRG
ncbi:hypothetical protein [Methylococcus geothermalis]|uniref:hypothetical protein n=1 Tax=Methylococcus geothermalis TaxID=2681310 RepID=UPI00146B72C1|nr:hypothetical protein [Methylococcus geothermalis]